MNINAYHQPGVEAGKKAAGTFLTTLSQVRKQLSSEAQTAPEVATAIQADPQDVYHCLIHLAANGEAQATIGTTPADDRFNS